MKGEIVKADNTLDVPAMSFGTRVLRKEDVQATVGQGDKFLPYLFIGNPKVADCPERVFCVNGSVFKKFDEEPISLVWLGAKNCWRKLEGNKYTERCLEGSEEYEEVEGLDNPESQGWTKGLKSLVLILGLKLIASFESFSSMESFSFEFFLKGALEDKKKVVFKAIEFDDLVTKSVKGFEYLASWKLKEGLHFVSEDMDEEDAEALKIAIKNQNEPLKMSGFFG